MHTVTISKGNRDERPGSCKDKSQANLVPLGESPNTSGDLEIRSIGQGTDQNLSPNPSTDLCRVNLCSLAPTTTTLLTPITRTQHNCRCSSLLPVYIHHVQSQLDASRRSSFASLCLTSRTPLSTLPLRFSPSPQRNDRTMVPDTLNVISRPFSNSPHHPCRHLHNIARGSQETTKTVDSAHPSITDPAGRTKVRLSASRTMAPRARSPGVRRGNGSQKGQFRLEWVDALASACV